MRRNSKGGLPQSEERVRFDRGFHDAQAEAERRTPRNMRRHRDRVYAIGYESGYAEFQQTGARSNSSESAWRDAHPDYVKLDPALRIAERDADATRLPQTVYRNGESCGWANLNTFALTLLKPSTELHVTILPENYFL